MIPIALLEAVGLTAQQLVESSGVALDLVNALNVARSQGTARGAFFRFVNQYVAAVEGATRQDAAIAYKAAGYWKAQGKSLELVGYEMPLDRRLARPVMVDAIDALSLPEYKYQVDISITFPGETSPRTFTVWVPSDQLLTREGAIAQAEDLLFSRFASSSTPSDFGGELEDTTVSSRLASFLKYEVEGM